MGWQVEDVVHLIGKIFLSIPTESQRLRQHLLAGDEKIITPQRQGQATA